MVPFPMIVNSDNANGNAIEKSYPNELVRCFRYQYLNTRICDFRRFCDRYTILIELQEQFTVCLKIFFHVSDDLCLQAFVCTFACKLSFVKEFCVSARLNASEKRFKTP